MNLSQYLQTYRSYIESAKEQVISGKSHVATWLAGNLGYLKLAGFLIITVALLTIVAINQWPKQAKPDVLGLSTTQDFPQASNTAVATPTNVQSTIKVDVSGAVNQPGIVELRLGDRVDDALKAAGGYSDQADQAYLAQALNLAQKLADGDKLYIPSKNEFPTLASLSQPTATLVPSVYQPAGSVNPASHLIQPTSQPISQKPNSIGTSAPAPTQSGPVNINTATQAQLEELPGIGPSYAQKIISHRPYSSIDQVCVVGVVGTGSLCQKIKPLITM